MATINLLPWREERREQRKKEFISYLVLSFLLGLVISGLLYTYYNSVLQSRLSANTAIKTATEQLDAKLGSLSGMEEKRASIISRMKVVHDLQGGRPIAVHLFDDLTRAIPKNLYLTKFERNGDRFTIEGSAENPSVVSELLRNLEQSPWYRNVYMTSFIQKTTDTSKLAGAVVANVTPQASLTAGTAPPQSTVLVSVAPDPEDAYGTFIVTSDLGDGTDSIVSQLVPTVVNQGKDVISKVTDSIVDQLGTDTKTETATTTGEK